MVRNCRHRMPTGATCHSPAMRKSAYCYYHARLRQPQNRRRPANSPIKLPVLDNKKALQVGLTDVMNAIASGQLDPRRGGRILYGMQMAATALNKLPYRRLAPDSTKVDFYPASTEDRCNRVMSQPPMAQ